MPADPTQPVPGPTREQPSDEQAMATALAPFGWTCGPEFWQRYYQDPWVFNLANAVERLMRIAPDQPARPSPTDDAARKALDDIFKAAAALARYQPFSGDDADRVSDQTLTNITAIAGRIADSRNLVLAEIERLREQNTALGVRIQQGWAEIERLRAQQGTA